MRLSPLVFCALLLADAASGFLIQTFESPSGRKVQQTWHHPDRIPFLLHEDGSDDLTPEQTHRLIRESFKVWADVASSRAGFLDRGETDSRRPSQDDGHNLVYFDETGRHLRTPSDSGVIAITRISSAPSTGRIIDADIIFNGRDFRFAAGDGGNGTLVNLKDVAIHEIGHLLGLEHTPLDAPPATRPTMNPFNRGDGPGEGHSLEPDDIAGISVLYPAKGYRASVGTISGRVTDSDEKPLFGTHITAENLDTVELFSTVSGAEPDADSEGHYRLHGLTPGRYRLSMAPIEGTINEENFGGIFANFATGFPREYFDNARDGSYARILDLTPSQHIGDIDFVSGFVPPGFPLVLPVSLASNTPDASGPYGVSIEARNTDQAWLLYRLGNSDAHHRLPMHEHDGLYFAEIPGQPIGTRIAYQIEARSANGNVSVFPNESAWLDFAIIELTGSPLAFTALRGDDAVGVVDTGTRRELARIPVGDEPIQVLLSDGKLFVSNLSSNDISVIETATFQVLRRIETAVQPLDMALAPDGQTVYVTNSGAGNLTTIDVGSGRARTIKLAEIGSGPYAVAVTADKIFTTDIGNSQVLVVTLDGRIARRIDVPMQPRSLALAPNGQTLYVTSMGTGLLTLIDPASDAVSGSFELDANGTFAVAPSPDGHKIYLTAHDDDALIIIDAQSGAPLQRIAIGRNPRAISFSPDGKQAYVTSSFSHQVHVIDTRRDILIGHYASGQNPRGIALVTSPLTLQPTAISESPPQPAAVHLEPNYPNPFNIGTQIRYALAAEADVELRIYNALGQQVRTLVRARRSVGRYYTDWDGRDDWGTQLASGTYLLEMRAGGVRQAAKMLLLR